MNMSMCLISLNKYEDAIGHCQEALRIDKNNIKALYRISFSYFKLDKFEESKKFIKESLAIQPDSKEFKSLSNDIIAREKEIEDQSRKLFKKIRLGDNNKV